MRRKENKKEKKNKNRRKENKKILRKKNQKGTITKKAKRERGRERRKRIQKQDCVTYWALEESPLGQHKGHNASKRKGGKFVQLMHRGGTNPEDKKWTNPTA